MLQILFENLQSEFILVRIRLDPSATFEETELQQPKQEAAAAASLQTKAATARCSSLIRTAQTDWN